MMSGKFDAVASTNSWKHDCSNDSKKFCPPRQGRGSQCMAACALTWSPSPFVTAASASASVDASNALAVSFDIKKYLVAADRAAQSPITKRHKQRAPHEAEEDDQREEHDDDREHLSAQMTAQDHTGKPSVCFEQTSRTPSKPVAHGGGEATRRRRCLFGDGEKHDRAHNAHETRRQAVCKQSKHRHLWH